MKFWFNVQSLDKKKRKEKILFKPKGLVLNAYIVTATAKIQTSVQFWWDFLKLVLDLFNLCRLRYNFLQLRYMTFNNCFLGSYAALRNVKISWIIFAHFPNIVFLMILNWMDDFICINLVTWLILYYKAIKKDVMVLAYMRRKNSLDFGMMFLTLYLSCGTESFFPNRSFSRGSFFYRNTFLNFCLLKFSLIHVKPYGILGRLIRTQVWTCWALSQAYGIYR